MNWSDARSAMEKSKYDEKRYLIESGDILLCSGNSTFSKLIKKFTDSKWSHVGFILHLKSPNRLMVMESVESIGVRTVTLSSYLNNYNGSGKPYDGEIMIARHRKMKDCFIEKLSAKAIDLLGHPYDKDEIIRITARIATSKFNRLSCSVPKGDNEYICSEYVDECYRSIGINIKPSCGFITPADFANDENIYPVVLF